MKIVLSVRHRGHVPSFKNKKRVRVQKGRPIVFTQANVKKWMDEVIQDFESQLFCATQTTGDVTLTVPRPRSSIVSSLPLDDSRQWISQLLIVDDNVPVGEEGAIITIEEIP